MTKIHKRFIAGAICPQCQMRDRIVVFGIEGEQHIECVNCGFSQSQNNFLANQPAKPKEAIVKFTKNKTNSTKKDV